VKIDMDIVEDEMKTGMFSKTKIFRLNVKAQLTEEERQAALQAGDLIHKTFIIYDCIPGTKDYKDYNGVREVNVAEAMGGFSSYYADTLGAQNAMENVKVQYRLFKENIEAVQAPRSQSFEL